MRLSELLEIENIPAGTDGLVRGLTADSREVTSGYVFAALVGSQSDGRNFIDKAIENGAIAVLVDQEYDAETCPVYCFKTENPRQKLSSLAARFYGGMPAVIVAVTGTNGKTSVAHFVRSIWQKLGIKSASLGTLGVVTDEGVTPLHYTSPEPVLLHQKLKEMKDAGITHLALEASSHGLDQHRLDAVPVNVAAFTNLTRDHLDYHHSSDDYLNAKLGLVSRIVSVDGSVVLNADSDVYDVFRKSAEDRDLNVISYGYNGSELRLKSVNSHVQGQTISLELFGEDCILDLPVAGEFQAMNILCALGMVIAAGHPSEKAASVLSELENVPGRMEQVAQLPSEASVYVDFAHTPDALKTVLLSLKPHVTSDIHAIIGCGGDRDVGKRPVMGKIAAELANHVYVTDDNPRSEDPAAIRAEIMTACPDALEIGDRKEAIQAAMNAAKSGDIVLVAGKGHESGQIVGTRVIPFNDKQVVQEIAKAMEAAHE